MRKIHEYKSRVKSWVKVKARSDGGSGASVTATSNPNTTECDALARIKSEGWKSLKALLDTLDHATGVIKLSQVKTVIEGFANCVGIYEEAAQARKEYDDLRKQLEGIFEELELYISSSPVITWSIENICGSIQKEIEYVQNQQQRPVGRRIHEAETDAENTLKCYRRIKAHLQRLTRNANVSTWIIVDQIATENRLRELAPSLWACYDSEKALELKRRSCTEGTRTNVLAQMHQWVASKDTGNIYWMSGMAGTGKTTIAYSLCEQLDTEATRLLCASFFCSRSLPECRDVGRIIPSIAYQLAQFSRPFRYALSQSTARDPIAHTRLPRKQFECLIEQPFSDMKVREAFPTNMVVVIDALDECDDTKSTKQILDVLINNSKDLPIKFVLSSRPEPAIRDQMEKNGTWVDARAVLHELDNGEVQTDIRTYLKAELTPISPLETEVDQLVARAGVLFIYAATVVRYVGYADFSRNPRGRLREILEKTGQSVKAQTKDIDELYGIVLEAAFKDSSVSDEEQGDMKLILDTVVCAREPLTVAALNGLLQLNNLDRVHAALQPLWSVLHVMGSEMMVTTLHASFPDYLLDSNRSGAWHCDAASHQQLLAQRCFDCIRDTKPQFNICRLESSFSLDTEVADLDERVQSFISTELRYACQYWPIHLGAVETTTASDLIPLLSQFLSAQLLLWMEVRNLTNTFPGTLSDLTTVKRWATRRAVPRGVIELLSDAWRFASTFVSGPSQSTPHLYISILPMLSPSSPIRKQYSSRFRGMIGVGGTALDRRQDALLAQWKFELDLGCMACSSDGTRVAIGGGTGGPDNDHPDIDRIFLLDAFSGTLLLDLSQGDNAKVHSIAFSPDSTRLASGREDGVISVWDLAAGQPPFSSLRAHTDRVESILYSHNGFYIVSASKDKTIRIWDALTGDPALTPLIGHRSSVTCIAITSDDACVVSGSRDGTIRIWDIQSGESILYPITSPEYANPFADIAISPDDSRIISSSESPRHKIQVWDMKTCQRVLGPLLDEGRSMSSISISPSGSAIASASNIDGVRIWDAASGKIVSKLGPFSDDDWNTTWVAYLPDGTRIILARADGSIRLLDTQTVSTAPGPSPGRTKPIISIDISPDGRRVVSGGWDGPLCFWDLAEGKLLLGPLEGHITTVRMVRFSLNGSRIVSCSDDKTVRQWDAHSGAMYGTPIRVPSGREVWSATYSRDGALIVSLTSEGELSVWNSSNSQSILGPIAAPSQTRGVHAEFSPDSTTAIAGYSDGSIHVWDVQNGQMLYGHKDDVGSTKFAFALFLDDWHCARYSEDRKISLQNIHTKRKTPGSFEGHTNYVTSMRFSCDSARLVSGSVDHNVHIWDVRTGQSLFGPLHGHSHHVNSVAFSPDGKYVVSGSEDRTIRVWNVQPQTHSSKDREVGFANWVLDKDGWVVSGQLRRLFWVPSDLRNCLIWPRNTMVLCREGYLQLRFEDAFVGEAWGDIWRNV